MEEQERRGARVVPTSLWCGGVDPVDVDDSDSGRDSEDEDSEYELRTLEFKDGFVYTTGHPRILLSWGDRDLLGEGSYAKVYHATSLYGSRSYALKVIVKKTGSIVQGNGSARDPKTVHSVLNECTAMWELRRHPNVVRFHEAYTFRLQDLGECQAIVMEYCESDLFLLMDECVRKQRPWPEERIFDVISRVFGALFYMHRLGWLHRDVKLENVLVKADGSVRLADFGFACRYTPGDTHAWSCGSPHYSCPEIASGDTTSRFHGPHADVWSTFVVLFAMSHLRMPFCQTKDPGSVIRSILNNWRTSPPPGRAEIPRSPALSKFLKFGLYPNDGRLRWPDQIVEDEWVTTMLAGLPRERLDANPLFKERRFMENIRKNSLAESVRSVMGGVVDPDQVSYARFLDACALEETLQHRKILRGTPVSPLTSACSSSSSSSSSISSTLSPTLSSSSPTLEASLFPALDAEPRSVKRSSKPVCGVIVATAPAEESSVETPRFKPSTAPADGANKKTTQEAAARAAPKAKGKSRTAFSKTCVCWSRDHS